ncbi:MAG: MFS transporter [Myxococcales bacterium]|nr:MFS transporter [Myxococcales bacterium]
MSQDSEPRRPESDRAKEPAFAAFRFRDFSLFQGSRALLTIGIQMQSVAVGWHVYDITRRPLDLGYVGLAQFLPLFLLSLVAGSVADRFDRKKILMTCHVLIGASAVTLALMAQSGMRSLEPIYAVLFLFGCVRAFIGPAAQSFLPFMVPAKTLPSAVAWSSAIWQLAAIVGPALGGIVYAARGAALVYVSTASLTVITFLLTALLRVKPEGLDRRAIDAKTIFAGVSYVLRNKMILGTISLDLFAVLCGGAVALLPAFARDVLFASPLGLGLLRSAPSVGAALMAASLAVFPLGRRAGIKMLLSVMVFGAATVVFALSRSLWLSVAALAVTGAADMISVVVRSTVLQLATPPEMRGRVSAVNMIFVGASNELGEFESGLTASWLGLERAAAVGGFITCGVVALWSVLFPSLRRIDRLDDCKPG